MNFDAYRGQLAANSAAQGQQVYRNNAQFDFSKRQAKIQSAQQRNAANLAHQQNVYGLYTQAGQLGTNAYQNQLANSGNFRNFALGALSGLMR